MRYLSTHRLSRAIWRYWTNWVCATRVPHYSAAGHVAGNRRAGAALEQPCAGDGRHQEFSRTRRFHSGGSGATCKILFLHAPCHCPPPILTSCSPCTTGRWRDWASQFGFSESVKRKFVEPFIGFTFSARRNDFRRVRGLAARFQSESARESQGGMMQLARSAGVKTWSCHRNECAGTADRTRTRRDSSPTTVKANTIHRDPFQVSGRRPARQCSGTTRARMRERATGQIRKRVGNTLQGNASNSREPAYLADRRGRALRFCMAVRRKTIRMRSQYFNILTYRSDKPVQDNYTPSYVADMFEGGKYERLLELSNLSRRCRAATETKTHAA